MLDFRFNTHSYFPESGLEKRFQAPGMCAIDFPMKLPPEMILREKFQNFSIFASIHTSISLNKIKKRFQGSRMRTIDSPHKITHRRSLVKKFSTRP
jgi:hypothetical protein